MPTYEYRCPNGHDFERFVLKMSEASSTLPCPTCGAEATRRISAGGGLVFKGSGFYITDYGKDGKKDQRAHPASTSSTRDAASKDAAGTAAAAKPAGGADAKPAATESKPAAASPPSPSKGNSES